jgi:hypothetical protein
VYYRAYSGRATVAEHTRMYQRCGVQQVGDQRRVICRKADIANHLHAARHYTRGLHRRIGWIDALLAECARPTLLPHAVQREPHCSQSGHRIAVSASMCDRPKIVLSCRTDSALSSAHCSRRQTAVPPAGATTPRSFGTSAALPETFEENQREMRHKRRPQVTAATQPLGQVHRTHSAIYQARSGPHYAMPLCFDRQGLISCSSRLS